MQDQNQSISSEDPIENTQKWENKHFTVVAAIAIFSLFLSGASLFVQFGNLSGSNLSSSVLNSIDSSAYQVVQLDTGEVYFAKIIKNNNSFITLADIYYFYEDDHSKLVKHGNEAHEPKDEIFISCDRVVFSEALREDGKIMRAIQKYQQKQN